MYIQINGKSVQTYSAALAYEFLTKSIKGRQFFFYNLKVCIVFILRGLYCTLVIQMDEEKILLIAAFFT